MKNKFEIRAVTAIAALMIFFTFVVMGAVITDQRVKYADLQRQHAWLLENGGCDPAWVDREGNE